MNKKVIYYWNPDFRRRAPSDGPYCCICQKAIKDASKAKPVTWSGETMQMVDGHGNGAFIGGGPEINEGWVGSDCYQKLEKE